MAANKPSITARELLLGARIAIDASYGDGTSAQQSALVAALAQAVATQHVADALLEIDQSICDCTRSISHNLDCIASQIESCADNLRRHPSPLPNRNAGG
jgi:hypothetical protein